MRLLHLKLSWDVVQSAILSEMRPGLLEMERHVGSHALFADAKHPVIIADAGIMA